MRWIAEESFLVIALLSLVAGGSVAQPTETKLFASDPIQYSNFGRSVSISGDVALVGSVEADGNIFLSGAAYLYRFDGTDWVEESKLFASDGAHLGRFGSSVALEGDTAVIGAEREWGNVQGAGAAYVFRFDGTDWVEEAKLVASDGASADWFGNCVAISGDAILIGAKGDDDRGSSSGSAYVFRRVGVSWVEEAKLVASDGSRDEWFGQSVAISGDAALVGAPYDRRLGARRGSAYVFRFDGTSWGEEAKLLASDTEHNDLFGTSVAMSGNVALVGTWDSWHVGTVYAYELDGAGWIETKLTASDGALGDMFGRGVALAGRTAVIGASAGDGNTVDSGTAYVFRWNETGWVEEAKLQASDGDPIDAFGESVAVSGNRAVIGARLDDDFARDSGAAYVFDGLLTLEAAIDIRPCDDRNRINPFGRGLIPVALIGSGSFDVDEVDVTTLTFGPAMASPAFDLTDPFVYFLSRLWDVNEDGYGDLTSHYRVEETGIARGDTEACLTGQTRDGIPFEGCDAVTTVSGCGLGSELAFLLPLLILVFRQRSSTR